MILDYLARPLKANVWVVSFSFVVQITALIVHVLNVKLACAMNSIAIFVLSFTALAIVLASSAAASDVSPEVTAKVDDVILKNPYVMFSKTYCP